ncbi:hypothetical protein CHF27_005790 [Romboutsia maritimum]|uniref:DUF3794 domain-containing protein n=1 Tax=Romboutsia maritimum TaxID=2020948 RepID=A0A255HTQ5_9FIRM|nr:hypothetical protein [Romboutsia maritimum]RDY23863.1 hypothetical protein CHF27_005790 [Romboutsia maritimum]
MNIKCAQPFEIEFKTGILVDCTMDAKRKKDDIKDFTIAVNTDKLFISVVENKVDLNPSIIVDNPCKGGDSIKVDSALVNEIHANGVITYVLAADLLLSSSNVTIVPPQTQGWSSSTSNTGHICLDDKLIGYAENLNDKYELKVTISNLILEDIKEVTQDNQFLYVISGDVKVEAVKITPPDPDPAG